MALSLWRRRVAVLVTAFAVLNSTTAFAQNVADIAAKASMADGDKAAKNKDWKTAITSYDAANKASPSEQALDSLANAYYQSGDLGGAWSAYNEWNDKYAAKASATKKQIATTRLTELTGKTGGVTITVSEPNATITVDDKLIGTSPLPGQLRMVAGPHHVKITKDGFTAFDQSPTVATGTMTAIDAKLVATNAKGKIAVTEKGGHQVRVIIDGIDRGPAPWSGDIEPGPHDVAVKGNGWSATQKVSVVLGTPAQVDLVATNIVAPIRIATDDNQGQIFLDGQMVGQGVFQGQIGGGSHEIKISRDGYETLTQTISVDSADAVNKTYSLKLAQNVKTTAIEHEVDRLHGVYGGFNLVGFATPGGTGNAVEQQCDNKSQIPTLKSCDISSGLGAGLGGFVGYHWDKVGVELFVAGDYDSRKDTETWSSAAIQGSGANPARTEDYTFRRYGVMALARVRLTKQWDKIRLTMPIGAGISWRGMKLTREATGVDGTHNNFAPDAVSYTSPTIELEPTVAYRLTPGVAITLGVQFFLEAPASFLDGNDNPTTKGSTTQHLGLNGLSSPSYILAENAQVFIGPVIGMMFGP